MEFPTTDKQIKMWCFAYADEQRDFSATMDIDGADRVERAKRLYDFISSYEPSSLEEKMKPRVSLLSRLKSFLRLKGRG